MDYEPTPGDLSKIADADLLPYSPYVGFADQLTQAAGSRAESIQVNLENTPANIRDQVTKLGAAMGTSTAAAAWLAEFVKEYAELSARVKAAVPKDPGTAVADVFVPYWAGDFAGLTVASTFGPQPVTASQLADLAATSPAFVVGNSATPDVPEISGASPVMMQNFPGDDLDLLEVFRNNARTFLQSFAG